MKTSQLLRKEGSFFFLLDDKKQELIAYVCERITLSKEKYSLSLSLSLP